MSETALLCPQCGTPINSAARYCSGCGIDISVITLLLEHAAAVMTESHALPIGSEVLVPRLGEFLINRNLITEAQLQQALHFQKDNASQGAGKMLGETLVELGLISRPDLERAIVAQVLDLQAALQASNRQLAERVAERTNELELALRKASEINQLKADFVSNISHELRTPLAQIKGYVAMLVDGMLGELHAEQIEAMRSTQAATERLQQLIEDLIRFSSAAKGELVINTSVFCLSELVQSVFNRKVAKANRSTLQMTVEVPPDPVYARGDVEKLSWVLLQLIDNAIKFTPDGGFVKVGLRLAPQPRVLSIFVSDSGIGIPTNRIHELFQPFHQLDGSSTRRYGGTGLGLALVQRIIEAHGSEIQIDSVVGKGSTFSFDLSAVSPA